MTSRLDYARIEARSFRQRFMLILVVLPFMLLLLLDCPVQAATVTTCQDGAKVTIDGVIHKGYYNKNSTRFYVETPALDCGPVAVLVKKAGTCKLGMTMHATGVLTEQGHMLEEGWKLGDKHATKSMEYTTSFSCK